MNILEATIINARNGQARKLKIQTDKHGCVVELEGVDETLVLDLAGTLCIFISDNNGGISRIGELPPMNKQPENT